MANDEARIRQGKQAGRFARLAGRHEPVAVSAFNLFQTPVDLAARLVASLGPLGRALEPSAGLGRLLDALAHAGGTDTTAIEIAPQLCAQLYRQERGVKLLQRDFLTVLPDEIGHFDTVVMNPPFHMRADVRHILHALDFLKPGGRLAAICMDTDHREKALRHMADTWEKLPPSTFKETGTSVPTVLLTMTA